MTSIQKSSFFAANRNVVIAGSVLLFHALAIWALQAGLLMRVVETIVPVEILAQTVELPTPKSDPAPPKPTKPPEPIKQVVSKPKQVTQVAPTLLAVADTTPTPNAPSVQPISPPAVYVPTVAVAAVAAPAPPAPPAAPKVMLPSSDADYLRNPEPIYPVMSKRLREQGVVQIRVLVSALGLPLKIELVKSSGFERLDQAALAVIPKWRFTPGKINGVAADMSYITPVRFELE